MNQQTQRTLKHLWKKPRKVKRIFLQTTVFTVSMSAILCSQGVSAMSTNAPLSVTTEGASIHSVTLSLPAPEKDTSASMREETDNNESEEIIDPYVAFAIQAGVALGWDPLFVYSQWRLETGNFTSNVFVQNNNLAGQTWYPGCGYEKGTPRPSKEGGFYIKYPSPVEGYIEFVQRSPRYSNVKFFKTPEEQAEEVARQGWSEDSDYAQKLKTLIQESHAKYGHVLVSKR